MKKIIIFALVTGILPELLSFRPQDKNDLLNLSYVRINPTVIRAFHRDDFILIPRNDYKKLEKLIPELRQAKHEKKFYRILSRKLLRLLSAHTIIIDRRTLRNTPDFYAVYIDDKRILLLRNAQFMELLLSVATNQN